MCVCPVGGLLVRRCTHTFSSGDVHGAGDVGEALVHAHLQEDDPVMGNAHNVQYMTGNIHMRSFNTHAHKRTQAGISSLTSAKSDRHLLAHLYLFMYTHIHTHTHIYTHTCTRHKRDTHTHKQYVHTHTHSCASPFRPCQQKASLL